MLKSIGNQFVYSTKTHQLYQGSQTEVVDEPIEKNLICIQQLSKKNLQHVL
jgi:hypothetical protein